jgi:hypothetical protein
VIPVVKGATFWNTFISLWASDDDVVYVCLFCVKREVYLFLLFVKNGCRGGGEGGSLNTMTFDFSDSP